MTPTPDAERGPGRTRELAEIVGVFALIGVVAIAVLVMLDDQVTRILVDASQPI